MAICNLKPVYLERYHPIPLYRQCFWCNVLNQNQDSTRRCRGNGDLLLRSMLTVMSSSDVTSCLGRFPPILRSTAMSTYPPLSAFLLYRALTKPRSPEPAPDKMCLDFHSLQDTRDMDKTIANNGRMDAIILLFLYGDVLFLPVSIFGFKVTQSLESVSPSSPIKCMQMI